jgi:hypothetical protein
MAAHIYMQVFSWAAQSSGSLHSADHNYFIHTIPQTVTSASSHMVYDFAFSFRIKHSRKLRFLILRNVKNTVVCHYIRERKDGRK